MYSMIWKILTIADATVSLTKCYSVSVYDIKNEFQVRFDIWKCHRDLPSKINNQKIQFQAARPREKEGVAKSWVGFW